MQATSATNTSKAETAANVEGLEVFAPKIRLATTPLRASEPTHLMATPSSVGLSPSTTTRRSTSFVCAPRAYSVRRAFMGEIEAARLAGMRAATNAQTASAPAAKVKARGSQLETL